LEGSIPAQGLLDIARFRQELNERPRPADVSVQDWKLRHWKQTFARTDEWLDKELAARHLADPLLAQEVTNALYFFTGTRINLLAFVVMPNHFHWVFKPLEEWVMSLGTSIKERSPRERIMQSVLRHAALECNKLLGRRGTFWQHESYDQWVRDADELERILHYIENNPVKAGLVKSPDEWMFSSAHDRKKYRLEFGQPLVRPKT